MNLPAERFPRSLGRIIAMAPGSRLTGPVTTARVCGRMSTACFGSAADANAIKFSQHVSPSALSSVRIAILEH
jgi:hypothetical protein